MHVQYLSTVSLVKYVLHSCVCELAVQSVSDAAMWHIHAMAQPSSVTN